MCVEWAKTKAHADQWNEEVLLVTEEMCCTICFLEWKANWWLERAASCPDAPLHVQHGVAAYAAKQAAVCHSIAKPFAKCWYPILHQHNIAIEWPTHYVPCDSMDMDVS
jgi:hypothetical protein